MNEHSPLEISNDILLCPICESEYLHQIHVHVFNRKSESSKDQKITTIENTGGDESVLEHLPAHPLPPKNPSHRRQGLSIDFTCEDCHAPSRLHIYQYKGTSHIEWETSKHV